MEFPAIPEELLTALQNAFPDQCPDMKMSDREVWAAVGKQQVIQFLRRVFAEQNETIIER